MKKANSDAHSETMLGIDDAVRMNIRAGITDKSLKNGSVLNLNALAGENLTRSNRSAVIRMLIGYVGAPVQAPTDKEGVLDIPSAYRFKRYGLLRRIRLVMPA